jgi:hypothetical protein
VTRAGDGEHFFRPDVEHVDVRRPLGVEQLGENHACRQFMVEMKVGRTASPIDV